MKSATAIFAAATEPGAADVGVEARHVVQHADLDVICWACAVPHISAAANAAKLAIRVITSSLSGVFRRTLVTHKSVSFASVSNAEIVVQLFEVGVEFGIGEAFDDAAVLHDVMAVGDRRGETEVLLDQQDREALLLQRPGWCGRSAG